MIVVLDQTWFPLRRFSGKETIKVIEAIAGWPAILWADGRCFRGGRVMPLAERGSGIAVVPQDLSDRSRFFRNHSCVTIKRNGSFGNRARADSRVIPSGEQAGSRGRTNRSRVERVVT